MPELVVATTEMIERVFDDASEHYDRIGTSFFRQFGSTLVELMSIPSGARVLDIGTGNGAMLIPAARQVGSTGAVIGIDVSNEMLGQADRAARAVGLSNYQLGRMDAAHLEFADHSFDAVTCGFALFFLPSMEEALREMHRVCKPGGQIGLSVWGKTPPPFDPAWKLFAEQVRKYGVEVRMPQKVAYAPQEIQALLTGAGFVDIRIQSETADAVYESAEDWWSFQLTTGSRAAIYRMSPETREQFKMEYLNQLQPLFRADGLHLPAPALFSLARHS